MRHYATSSVEPVGFPLFVLVTQDSAELPLWELIPVIAQDLCLHV